MIIGSAFFAIELLAYVLAVTDKKLPTRIQVIKVDEKSNPLAGVQLQVLDSSGNIIIPTWTTDGKPYEITGKLEVGQTYKLHEVKTLTEYTLSKDVSFTVKDTTEVQTVRMINRKKTGQVVIKKLDGDGKALVGAQWKILIPTTMLSDSTAYQRGCTPTPRAARI